MNRILQRVSPLVSTKWLHGKMSAKPTARLRVLDGSLFDDLEAKEEYAKRHIPGAQFFDIVECRDHNSPYPRMLPSAKDFEEYVGRLGINNDTHVVVYDSALLGGFFSAPRVWWMMRYFGHDSVSLLNGGLARWIKDNYKVTDEILEVEPEIFKAQPRKELVKHFEDMVKAVEEKSVQIADARGPKKFKNRILGAMNLPHKKLHLGEEAERPEFKTPEEIKKTFKEYGIDMDKPFIAACNSGVTACTLAFSAFLCGREDVPIYDGSWQEWHNRADEKLVIKDPDQED